MSMLDALLGMCFRWFSGGKTDYRDRKFAEWMPADWASDSPKAKVPDMSIQFDEFVKANSR